MAHTIKRPARRLAALAAITMLISLTAPDPVAAAQPPAPGQATRLSGPDRVATAIAVSEATYTSAKAVVIATAADFPDALAAAPFAYALDAPLLLVGSDPTQALFDELDRLGVEHVIVVGGEAAVSFPTMIALMSASQTRSQPRTGQRIAGDNRYDTAAMIAEGLAEVLDRPVDGAYVVSGTDFPDAVAAAPLAARQGRPLLLSTRDTLPDETADALDEVDGTITLVGGTGVLSADLDQHADDRIAGPNRFETALAIHHRVRALHGDQPLPRVWLATGTSYPDALAAGAPVAATDSTLLLVTRDVLPGPVADELNADGTCDPANSLTVVGGTGAVSDQVLDQAADTWLCPEQP